MSTPVNLKLTHYCSTSVKKLILCTIGLLAVELTLACVSAAYASKSVWAVTRLAMRWKPTASCQRIPVFLDVESKRQEDKQIPMRMRKWQCLSNKGLNALESLYGGKITLVNSVDKTSQTFVSTPHQRSTTVSLENNTLLTTGALLHYKQTN